MRFIVLTFIIMTISQASHASTEINPFASSVTTIAPGTTVTLDASIRAYQYISENDTIESRYAKGTKLVIDKVEHTEVGIPGFRRDRYTVIAHLPTCITNCKLKFGYSRSKTIYNIDVSSISEHVYFPRQLSVNEMLSSGPSEKN